MKYKNTVQSRNLKGKETEKIRKDAQHYNSYGAYMGEIRDDGSIKVTKIHSNDKNEQIVKQKSI